jgi:hypothetical protein
MSKGSAVSLNPIDYQQMKEEEFETLKIKLDTTLQQCDICYQSFQG